MRDYGTAARGEVADLRAENKRLKAAITEAHRQLSRYEFKGPKQIGRALITLERAIPALDASVATHDAAGTADQPRTQRRTHAD